MVTNYFKIFNTVINGGYKKIILLNVKLLFGKNGYLIFVLNMYAVV